MEYKKIISITGKSGLFELLTPRADGAVVKSLTDHSTKFISSRLHQFSQLDSIEVYTQTGNISLKDVFVAMKSSVAELPEANDKPANLKSYFDKIYPGLDYDRVFNSDLKKMIKWFLLLNENNIIFDNGDEDATEEEVAKENE